MQDVRRQAAVIAAMSGVHLGACVASKALHLWFAYSADHVIRLPAKVAAAYCIGSVAHLCLNYFMLRASLTGCRRGMPLQGVEGQSKCS